MSATSKRERAYEAFLAKFIAAHPSVQPIESTDPAEISEFIVKNAPAETTRQWLTELISLSDSGSWKWSIGTISLALAGFAVAGFLSYGLFGGPDLVNKLATPDNARGLITFLFAFATIAVVLIIVIATFWVKPDEIEKRGTMAKEVLAILIGIMGTILGFYFGSANTTLETAPPTVNVTPADGANPPTESGQ